MCLNPTYIPDVGDVGCRKCWQCRQRRVDDLSGRCIAEQMVSSKTVSLTLTYADDLPNAAVLIYRDVQLCLKKLRKWGAKFTYLVVGEFGSKNGRAHWHLILFLKDTGRMPATVDRPEWRKGSDFYLARRKNDPDARVQWQFWPHGFTYMQDCDQKAFNYVCKYVLKGEDYETDTKHHHKSQSNRQPLGHDWFMELVDVYVKRRLSPQTPAYSFRHVFDTKGRRKIFWLKGRMRQLFCDAFLARWREVYDTEPPYSEFMELHEDDQVRQMAEAAEIADLQSALEEVQKEDFGSSTSFKWPAYRHKEEFQTDVWTENGWRKERSLGHLICLPVVFEATETGHVIATLEDGTECHADAASAASLTVRLGLPPSMRHELCAWLLKILPAKERYYRSRGFVKKPNSYVIPTEPKPQTLRT